MSNRVETQVQSVEHAYKLIAQQILSFLCDRPWDEAGAKYGVTGNSVSSSWWRKQRGIMDEKGKHPSREISYAVTDAVFYLRDHLLRTTGHRIWGLIFTLYPDGKFNIEYDYNKPPDYEETDETVDLSHALEVLRKQGVSVSKK